MFDRWWQGPKKQGEIWHKDRSVRSFDGTTIRYTVLGSEGPPVALCAGFLCPDTYWKYLTPALAGERRVVVWNYRGIGVSGLPRQPGYHAYAIGDDDLSIEANVRDLKAVLDDAGISDVALVGHSMGVQVALEAIRLLGSRVTHLVAIAGPYRTPLRTFYRTDLSARLVPIALPLMHALPRVSLLAWRALANNPLIFPAGVHVARAIGKRTKPEDMKGYFDHVSRMDPLIAAKMVKAMHDHDATDVLGKIDVPVLILHGTSDPFTPLVVAEEMELHIANARLVVFEGGSHTLPIEYPDEISREVTSFL
jgi:pimeloyl-ACP methyl ester carboxylesterase